MDEEKIALAWLTGKCILPSQGEAIYQEYVTQVMERYKQFVEAGVSPIGAAMFAHDSVMIVDNRLFKSKCVPTYTDVDKIKQRIFKDLTSKL